MQHFSLGDINIVCTCLVVRKDNTNSSNYLFGRAGGKHYRVCWSKSSQQLVVKYQVKKNLR